MSKINIIMQSKGGVGKSIVAILLAQYALEKKIPVVNIDTDPYNQTFLKYKKLDVEFFNMLVDGYIEIRNFDELFERLLKTKKDVIIDTGSLYTQLLNYQKESQLLSVLKTLGHEIIIHCPIVGGSNLDDTSKTLISLYDSLPEVSFCVWLNYFFGDVVYEGKSFTELAVYKKTKSKINALIDFPKYTIQNLAGQNFSHMLNDLQTFAEYLADITDSKKDFLSKSRINKIRSDLYESLDKNANHLFSYNPDKQE